MHTHDVSQLQSGTVIQPSVVPLVPEPSNSHSPQMQASQVLVQPVGLPQPGAYLPSSSVSPSLVHTQLSSQVSTAQLPPQTQPIPPIFSASVGHHIQSVGHSGNLVQQPAPFIRPAVPTSQTTTIPFIHSHPHSQPYYASYHAPSYPISRVQEPSFPFFLNDDPEEFAMLQLVLINMLSPHESETLQIPYLGSFKISSCSQSNFSLC